uniref:Sushi domain-containing protein n=1 Tax=Catharus ustulatus TaxID=91951 RepID=A0A8C3TYQ4_CATUS
FWLLPLQTSSLIGKFLSGQAGRCGTPPVIQSGELLVFPLQEYQQGDTVEYKCPDFYILEGSPTITCHNGQWTSPPVCLVACTASEEDMDRNNIELKWVVRSKLYSTSGDHIEFRCKPGYLRDPSSSSFRVQCVEGTLKYPRWPEQKEQVRGVSFKQLVGVSSQNWFFWGDLSQILPAKVRVGCKLIRISK